MGCRTARSLSCLMLPVTHLLPKKKPLLQNDSRASSQASLLLFCHPSRQYCGRHIKKTLPLPLTSASRWHGLSSQQGRGKGPRSGGLSGAPRRLESRRKFLHLAKPSCQPLFLLRQSFTMNPRLAMSSLLNSLCSPNWPQTLHSLLVSASQVLTDRQTEV